MNENIKLSVVMELLNKEIVKVNSVLKDNNTDSILNEKLNYLLNVKKSIYSGNNDVINEFLEKYKENKL